MNEVIDAYCTLGTERETRLAPAELLRWMDEAGIHRAVIAPEDREIALHNSSGNGRVVQISRQSQGRFVPACAVNPWFGESACQELRRAVADGAQMLVLAPSLQGFCFCDDLPDQLLAVAAELHVLVYVHTGPHSFGAATQLVVAAAEHPDVRFILGHCATTDYGRDMPAVIILATENVWFDLSLMRSPRGVSTRHGCRPSPAHLWHVPPHESNAVLELQAFGATAADRGLPRYLRRQSGNASGGGAIVIVDCHTHWGDCFQARDGLDPSQWLAGEARYGITHAVVAPFSVCTTTRCCRRKTRIWPRCAPPPAAAWSLSAP